MSKTEPRKILDGHRSTFNHVIFRRKDNMIHMKVQSLFSLESWHEIKMTIPYYQKIGLHLIDGNEVYYAEFAPPIDCKFNKNFVGEMIAPYECGGDLERGEFWVTFYVHSEIKWMPENLQEMRNNPELPQYELVIKKYGETGFRNAFPIELETKLTDTSYYHAGRSARGYWSISSAEFDALIKKHNIHQGVRDASIRDAFLRELNGVVNKAAREWLGEEE